MTRTKSQGERAKHGAVERPKWPVKIFVLTFLGLTHFFDTMWSDGLAEWKAFVSMGVAEICLVLCVAFGGVIMIGHRMDLPFGLPPKATIVIVVCILSIPTYKVLLGRSNLADHYKVEFDRYSGKIRGLLTIAAPLSVAAIIVAAFFLAITARRFR
jgi:hypothetical protein